MIAKPGGRGDTNNSKKRGSFACSKPLRLRCLNHLDQLEVPCGRWRTCGGCGMRKQWEVQQRLTEGIRDVPPGRLPMFFTLTFSAKAQPSEDQVHKAWRSLVARLRYRNLLGAYGWVLQRTKQGTLHMHGIAHLPWFDDDLALWRSLLTSSGFGKQNRLTVAEASQARYCARYIGTRWANLAPLRRAYGFSRDFPQTEYMRRKDEKRAALTVLEPVGGRPECTWTPEWQLLPR